MIKQINIPKYFVHIFKGVNIILVIYFKVCIDRILNLLQTSETLRSDNITIIIL
jgi:hypothetical protein